MAQNEKQDKQDKQETFYRKSSGLARTISGRDSLFANLTFIAPIVIPIFGILAAGVFQGGNLLLSVPIVLVPAVAVALIYMLMSATMPRSGGEYIWIGRIINPTVGFMVNFYITLVTLSYLGSGGAFMVTTNLAPMLIGLQATVGAPFGSVLSFVTTPNVSFAIGVLSLLVILLMIRGTRTAFRFILITVILSFVEIALIVIAFWVGGSGSFVSHFNAYSGMNYTGVISTATKGGYNFGFSSLATVFAGIYLLISFTGFNSNAYFGGEVKQAAKFKTQAVAMLGSVAIYGVLAIIFFYTLYTVMGYNFFSSLAYLFTSGNPAYTIPALPVPQLMAFPYTIPNAELVLITGVLGMVFQLGFLLVIAFVASRNIFAWSFDRVIPAKFSDVSRRYSSPYMAIILAFIIGVIYLVLYDYTTITAYFAYASFGFAVSWIVVGLAGVLLPYRRKDLFDTAPSFVKRKFLGIPAVAVIGLVAMISSGWLAVGSLDPAVVGTINSTYVLFIIVLLVVPIIIYAVSYGYQRRRGVPVDVAHKELPPE